MERIISPLESQTLKPRLGCRKGEEVIVMVNNLGATPLMQVFGLLSVDLSPYSPAQSIATSACSHMIVQPPSNHTRIHLQNQLITLLNHGLSPSRRLGTPG